MEVLGSSRGLAQGVLPWKHRGRGGRNGGILSLTHGGRAAMWARVYTHTHTHLLQSWRGPKSSPPLLSLSDTHRMLQC